MSFSAFEHKLIDHFKNQQFQKTLTVACSGGLDSLSLAYALKKIKPVLQCDLEILHVHHGSSEESDCAMQSIYRDKALDFVEKFAEEKSLKFSYVKSDEFLGSEERCRDFRMEVFKNHQNVLTAHHKDDFLETVLMRLLRGSGPQGLEDPFKEKTLKPFLELFKKEEIKDFAESNHMEWISDPSNKSTAPLRNWLRGVWLKELDEKIGKEGLEKSLMLISSAMKLKESAELTELIKFESEEEGFFTIESWLSLDRFQKQSMIAHILLKVRKKGYTHGQIEEVVKQLGQVQKNTTFRSGKIQWKKSESKVLFRLDL